MLLKYHKIRFHNIIKRLVDAVRRVAEEGLAERIQVILLVLVYNVIKIFYNVIKLPGRRRRTRCGGRACRANTGNIACIKFIML